MGKSYKRLMRRKANKLATPKNPSVGKENSVVIEEIKKAAEEAPTPVVEEKVEPVVEVKTEPVVEEKAEPVVKEKAEPKKTTTRRRRSPRKSTKSSK